MALSGVFTDDLSLVQGAWATWSPTHANITGGTENYAKFVQVGKTVFFRYKYTFAGAGLSGAIIISLPVTAHANYSSDDPIGSGIMLDTGVQGYNGPVIMLSTTTCELRPIGTGGATGTYGTSASSTVPFTWGNTDVLYMSGVYEAA